MNTKHTPGPWIVRYQPNLTAIVTPKGEIQLSLHGIWDGLKPIQCDLQEWQGNAQIIAAAPDLLEALKMCEIALRYVNYDGEYEGQFAVPAAQKAASAAIRKATESK